MKVGLLQSFVFILMLAHVNCLVFATTCLNGFEALEDRCER